MAPDFIADAWVGSIKVKEAIGFQSPPDAPVCGEPARMFVGCKRNEDHLMFDCCVLPVSCDLLQHPEHIAHHYPRPKEN